MRRGLSAYATERKTPSCFAWFTAAMAFLESLPPYSCALYPERKLNGLWKFGQWTIWLQHSISAFLTDFNLAISNLLSIANLKTSYTKASSRAIGLFPWRHRFQPCRSNCPRRIGGNSCISLPRIGQRPSKDMQTTISQPTGKRSTSVERLSQQLSSRN